MCFFCWGQDLIVSIAAALVHHVHCKKSKCAVESLKDPIRLNFCWLYASVLLTTDKCSFYQMNALLFQEN